MKRTRSLSCWRGKAPSTAPSFSSAKSTASTPNSSAIIADQLKEKLGAAVIVLASAGQANVNLVASVGRELTKQYHAGNIIKELAGMVGGGGGGRPDFAQAGGKDPTKIDAALKRAEELVRRGK